MQLSSAPSKLTLPFAASGAKNTIPVASQIPITPGAASYTDGFPPLTMTPVNEGGVPPAGKDFNGILNALSALNLWANAGGFFPWDGTFSTAVGGYPKGALVLKASGDGFWRSTADNNTSDPDTGGANWISFGSAVASSISASVYQASPQTLSSGTSKVLFDTTEFDSGLWDASGKRFVASLTGKYRVGGAVALAAPGGQLLATQVYKNGALAKQCFQAPQVSTGNLTLPFDAIINCTAGDYLEVYVSAPLSSVTTANGEPYVFAQCNFLGA